MVSREVAGDETAVVTVGALRAGTKDPGHFADVASMAGIAAAVRDLPSNHSPRYAPVLQPTLATGVAALATAVRTWLPPAELT